MTRSEYDSESDHDLDDHDLLNSGLTHDLLN